MCAHYNTELPCIIRTIALFRMIIMIIIITMIMNKIQINRYVILYTVLLYYRILYSYLTPFELTRYMLQYVVIPRGAHPRAHSIPNIHKCDIWAAEALVIIN